VRRDGSELTRADLNNPDALYVKGLVHYYQGVNDKGVRVLALGCCCHTCFGRDWLRLRQLRPWDAARIHLQEALRCDPDHGPSRVALKVRDSCTRAFMCTSVRADLCVQWHVRVCRCVPVVGVLVRACVGAVC
jgi:hypothetical protein